METYRCVSTQARERGAIGIFYRIEEFIIAADMYAAEKEFKTKYETNNFFVCKANP
jgi:hypothetical protein